MDSQPTPDERSFLTLTEAARLTGASVNALRHRIKRGKVQAIRGNDGMLRVRLDEADAEALKAGQAGEDADDLLRGLATVRLPGRPPGREAMLSSKISALQDQTASLQDRLHHVGRERDQARQNREDARVAAARAEGEARGLREALEEARTALAEARKPFWRRWTGL